MWERIKRTAGVCLGFSALAACASTSTPTTTPQTLSASQRPVLDAAPLTANDGITRTVVVAQSDKAIQTTWSSITDNQLVRSTAELANLGGPPVVIGAVAGIVVMDAKPRGRAARTATGVNGEVLPSDLDTGLVDEIEAQLVEAETADMTVRVQELGRLRKLPEDAWIVTTRYELAEDATALRSTAHLMHVDELRYEMEIASEMRRRDLSSTAPSFRTSSLGYTTSQRNAAFGNAKRSLRSRIKPPRKRLRRTFVHHSDSVTLPEVGDLTTDDQREVLEDTIVAALEQERARRKAAADARVAHARNTGMPEKKIAKAERKRDKAYAKADKLYTESMEKARDGQLDAMERLVLGVAAWGAPVEPGADATLIDTAVDKAQAFFAAAIAERLPGVTDTDPLEGRELTNEERVRGAMLVDADPDGRKVAEFFKGEQKGLVISYPDEGTSEYGRQRAKP